MPRPLQLLLVEDNLQDAELLLRELRHAGFEPVWQRVDTEAAYWAQLHAGLDLVLSDYSMPQFSGLRALELLKQSGLEVPFILVSSTVGEEMAVASIKQGAADYLIKDRLARLGSAVSHALEETRLRWEQKQAEENLRTSEERFRQLIENGSDIIAVLDAAGNILYQSPSTARVLGYQPEELTGHHSLQFVNPEDQAGVVSALQRVMAGQERPTPLEYRVRHRDGTWRTLQSLGKSMTGVGGEKLAVINSRDITQSRQLEEQLRQSQKMEAIGQLSGGVAHDFNNLLTVIKGHIGLLRHKDQVSPEIFNSIQQIDQAADRASNLTRQLLMFSRQQAMQPADHNLNSLVSNLTKMLRRLLSEDIELRVDCAPRPLPIRADEGMVEQVLLNLLVNARDAMPDGGVLHISTEAADLDEAAARQLRQGRPGAFACLTVTDSGSGITPEVLPRIFDPFFTTKEIGKGTGLGLATVNSIMQQHEGWISVESQAGHGTTFRGYFPRLASALREAVALQAAGIRGGHETVLFVEDEESVRTVGEVALCGLGYRVITANSGAEALQLWQVHRHEIDLLITDLVMPGGVNGRQLAERLEADNQRLPVIYMSGYSHEVAGSNFPLEDGRNYLPKPFDVSQLAKIVRTNLDCDGTIAPTAGP